MNPEKAEFPYPIVVIVVLITAGYIVLRLYDNTILASGALAGHTVGVVGFVLMLMTETLYSLRKRLKRAARWGSMKSWLQFHILTGIVGPYMVVLHSAWRFNSLAGLVTLLTVIVVLSGFIGRYIYTVVPRTAIGTELEGSDLGTLLTTSESQLRDWLAANPAVAGALPAKLTSLPELPHNTWLLIFGRVFTQWAYNWRWWIASRHLKGTSRQQIRVLGKLLIRRRQLHYQVASLAIARRVLAMWHEIHLPLGVALFTLAFFHIGAALYYALAR